MDVFDLAAKISLDTSDYEKGIDKSKGLASEFGEGMGTMKDSLSNFKDVFKGTLAADVVKKGFSAVVDGAKKAGEGLFNLVKDASNAYGEYQQMVGGVEKLYGKSAKTLVNYAQNAYMTSGMSANEYMDTATQFSSSLINSLKGNVKEAASQTDVAMRAISDNVNVFGSNMDDVTNAYKGFARQNYTMLDNLKLGYAGSKTGMEQLIKDANEWGKANGKASNLSINSFSDVITAIQQIQEKQNIAGTTAKEAMSTLQGTANMTKMAWENVKTAIGGGGDLNQAIDNLITSIVGKGDGTGLIAQWTPTIEKAMNGIGQLIGQAAPIISQYLPELIQNTVPNLLSALGSMFSAIMEALPSLFEALKTSISESMTGVLSPESLIHNITDVISQVLTAVSGILPGLITILGNVAVGLVQGITQAAPQIIQAIVQAIQAIIAVLPQLLQAIVNALPTILPALIQGVTQLIVSIAQALPQLIQIIVQALPTIIKSILDALQQSLPQIIKAVLELVTGIVQALPQIIQALIDALPEIIQMVIDTIIECLPMIITGLIQLIAAIVQALPQIISALIKAIPEIISAIIEAFKPLGQKLIEVGKDAVKKLWKGFKDRVSWIVSNVTKFAKSLPKKIKEQFKNIKDVGSNLVKGLWNGINDKVSWVVEKVKGFGKKVLNVLKDFFKIKSPSRVMRDQVGMRIGEGVAVGIDKSTAKAEKSARRLAKKVLNATKDETVKTSKQSDSIADAVVKSVSKTKKTTKKVTETKTLKSGKTKTTTKNKSVQVNKTQDEYDADVIKAGKAKVKTLTDANKMSEKQEASFWLSLSKKCKKGSVGYATTIALSTKATEKSQKSTFKKLQESLENYEAKHGESAQYEAKYWKTVMDNSKKGSYKYTQAQKQFNKASKKLGDERFKQMQDGLEKEKQKRDEDHQLTLADEYAYWQQQLDVAKKYPKSYEKVQKEISKISEKIRKQEESATKAYQKSLKSAQKEYEKSMEESYKKVESRRDDLLSAFSLGGKFDIGDPVSIAAMKDAQKSQLDAIDEYNAGIDTLRDKLGEKSYLFQELDKMGVNGLAYVRAFLQMSSSELQEFADNEEKKQKKAMDEANADMASTVKEDQKEALKTFLASQKEAWETLKASMKEIGVKLTDFGPETEQVFTNIEKSYSKILDEMGIDTTEELGNMKETINSSLDKLMPVNAKKGKKDAQEYLDALIGALTGEGSDKTDKATKKKKKKAKEKISSSVADIIPGKDDKKITEKVKALSTDTTSIVTNVSDIVTGKVKDLSKELGTLFDEIVNTISEHCNSIVTNMTQSGTDMMDAFINGARSKMGDLKSLMTELASIVANNIGFSEPKEGPLSDFHTYAPDMMELFATGIKSNGHLITDAFDETLGLGMPDSYGAVTVKADDSNSASTMGIEQILSVLQQYLPQLGNQQIILDSGELVGATAPGMNERLAYLNGRKAGAFA